MQEDVYTLRQSRANRALLFGLWALVLFVVGLIGAVAYLQKGVSFFGGFALMIGAVALHVCGRKNPGLYLLAFVVNSFANALVAASYYLSFDLRLTLSYGLQALIPGTILLLLAYVCFGLLQKGRKWTSTILILCNSLLIIAAVVLWARGDRAYYSLMFFTLLITLIYLIVFSVSVFREGASVRKSFSTGSFGLFALIALVVIILLSEGEALDGIFDGLDFPSSGKKKKGKTNLKK